MKPRKSCRWSSNRGRDRGRRRGSPWRISLLATVVGIGVGACAAQPQAVRPDEASAAAHRQEAARERAIADELQAKVVPGTSLPNPYRDPITKEPDPFYGPTIYNPSDGYLDAANRHREHALQHLAAARSLEAFEEMQCRDFPPAARAACPLLGPALSVEKRPTGVRITFAPAVRVDAVVAHMRCHLAYARAAGYPQPSACPLYLAGVEIEREGSTSTVDITSANPTTAARIQREANEEVVLKATRP